MPFLPTPLVGESVRSAIEVNQLVLAAEPVACIEIRAICCKKLLELCFSHGSFDHGPESMVPPFEQVCNLSRIDPLFAEVLADNEDGLSLPKRRMSCVADLNVKAGEIRIAGSRAAFLAVLFTDLDLIISGLGQGNDLLHVDQETAL